MNEAEILRSPENILLPDPRRKNMSIESLHSKLSKIDLNPNIPEVISIQFETAKNLFLYSWFVHRFHHISDLQAIATLELALKSRFDELKIEYWSRATLWKYLDKAVSHDLIVPEDIPGYFESARNKAKQRNFKEQLKRLIDENLKELEYDESEVLPVLKDFNPNQLSDTFANLVQARNTFAHGTTTLLIPNLNILLLTKSLINALYK